MACGTVDGGGAYQRDILMIYATKCTRVGYSCEEGVKGPRSPFSVSELLPYPGVALTEAFQNPRGGTEKFTSMIFLGNKSLGVPTFI